MIRYDIHQLLLFPLTGIDAVKGAATGIEEFNPRTNTWRQVASMETRRLQFGVAVVNNKLYVTGRKDDI